MTSEEKVIVISGVTTGLGNAMAREFIALGHRVAGCGRTHSKVQKLNEEFHPLTLSERCEFSVADVRDDEQVKAWATKVTAKFGPPDLLINNAGAVAALNNAWAISAEDFDRVIDTNVKGVANMVRHFLPAMVEANRGVVANVSSILGREAVPTISPYNTSKWALEGFSRTLAAELPECLTSFQLDPGLVSTPMTRIGCEPEEFAKLIPASDWAKKVCPAVLAVDRSMNGKILETSKLGLACGSCIRDAKIKLDD